MKRSYSIHETHDSRFRGDGRLGCLREQPRVSDCADPGDADPAAPSNPNSRRDDRERPGFDRHVCADDGLSPIFRWLDSRRDVAGVVGIVGAATVSPTERSPR